MGTMVTVIGTSLVPPLGLVTYSEIFWEKNKRWPADLDELKAFAVSNSVAGSTNALLSFPYYRSADFMVLTNGSLKIRYVVTVQTNSIATNQVLIPPMEMDSNGVWRISGIDIQVAAATNAEFAVTNLELKMNIKGGAD